MPCPVCLTQIPQRSSRCYACEADVKQCADCGGLIRESEERCRYCGTSEQSARHGPEKSVGTLQTASSTETDATHVARLTSVLVLLLVAVALIFVGYYLYRSSNSFSDAEQTCCDGHISQVVSAVILRGLPRPSGALGEAIQQYGPDPSFWDFQGGSVSNLWGILWRLDTPDTFTQPCKLAFSIR